MKLWKRENPKVSYVALSKQRAIIMDTNINRIQGKSMLENKKLSDREILY